MHFQTSHLNRNTTAQPRRIRTLQYAFDAKWFVVVLALVLLLPSREAHAALPSEGLAVAVAILAVVGVAVVAPIGAAVTTIDGEPSKEWGRTSLVGGGLATAAGAGTLIAGEFASDDDRADFHLAGGIVLGLGLNGLLWGIASEVTLPTEDPGIDGRPRPSGAPAGFTLRGSF